MNTVTPFAIPSNLSGRLIQFKDSNDQKITGLYVGPNDKVIFGNGVNADDDFEIQPGSIIKKEKDGDYSVINPEFARAFLPDMSPAEMKNHFVGLSVMEIAQVFGIEPRGHSGGNTDFDVVTRYVNEDKINAFKKLICSYGLSCGKEDRNYIEIPFGNTDLMNSRMMSVKSLNDSEYFENEFQNCLMRYCASKGIDIAHSDFSRQVEDVKRLIDRREDISDMLPGHDLKKEGRERSAVALLSCAINVISDEQKEYPFVSVKSFRNYVELAFTKARMNGKYAHEDIAYAIDSVSAYVAIEHKEHHEKVKERENDFRTSLPKAMKM